MIRDKILQQISTEIHFGIIVDSTLDIAHVDQLIHIIRDNGKIVDRFLEFISITGHIAKELKILRMLFKHLKKMVLRLELQVFNHVWLHQNEQTRST